MDSIWGPWCIRKSRELLDKRAAHLVSKASDFSMQDDLSLAELIAERQYHANLFKHSKRRRALLKPTSSDSS
jgi:hypothetical protein